MTRHAIDRATKRTAADDMPARMPRRLIQQAKREKAAAENRQTQRRLTAD